MKPEDALLDEVLLQLDMISRGPDGQGLQFPEAAVQAEIDRYLCILYSRQTGAHQSRKDLCI